MNKTAFFFLIIILFTPRIILAQDYVKLTFVILPRNISVEQGGTNSTLVYIENKYNETVLWISLKATIPNGVQISTRPEIIEDLYSAARKPFTIYLNTTNTISPGNYTITVWVESLMEISNYYIQSEKRSFNLEVIKAKQNQTSTNQTTTTTITQGQSTTTSVSINQSTTTSTITQATQRPKIPQHLRIPLALGIILILFVFLFVFLRK